MQKLCSMSELEDRQSRGFTLGENAIFSVRQGPQLFIYRNRCPHLGIQLEWLEDKFLDYDGELIQCSTHGALFTIDEGLCVSGPCGGQSLTPVSYEQRGDDIWVDL